MKRLLSLRVLLSLEYMAVGIADIFLIVLSGMIVGKVIIPGMVLLGAGTAMMYYLLGDIRKKESVPYFDEKPRSLRIAFFVVMEVLLAASVTLLIMGRVLESHLRLWNNLTMVVLIAAVAFASVEFFVYRKKK